MKHLSKIAFAIMVLSLTFFACSTEEETTNQSELANKQMIELLNSKFGVTTTFLGNGNFKFTYLDGRVLKTNTTEDKVTITGTRINNETLEFSKLSKDEISNITNSSSNFFLNSVNTHDFISKVNTVSNLESGLYAKPCDEHPYNEEFDDCFSREWGEFCDGFVGCMAQITNPVLIAAVIAGHCAAC